MRDASESPSTPDPRLPWVWIWTGGGIAIGLFDLAFMLWFGADLTVGGHDATLPISALFVVSYGAMGWLVGRLVAANLQAKADAVTIERQMHDLEHAQRALVQQEKLAAIGRLAAGVAHEVRNPLGVIRASAAMVRESFEPGEDPHRACEFICEEIDRLNGLIDGLLSFARPTRLDLEATSIEKVIDRALHLVADELKERAIEVERFADSAVPELRADPDLLSQVVYGLVLNAAQAIGRDGRVRIGVRSEPGAEDVCIDVADDGPGVDPSVADQLFEPFVTTKATGTGLGLAMAQRIVEGHGGALVSLTEAGAGAGGQGACFRIQLPLDAGEVAAAETSR